MNALVGCTGFVGSNIYAAGGMDRGFHSRNIEEAYGLKPDLLIYAGLRAEKYLANREPEKDMELILQAEENIGKINPKKLVLISTIDVFKEPVGVDETSQVFSDGLGAYGLNRYRLECFVRETYPDALIIRLPGLFGQNIKKNFIYDLIHVIPFMLKEDKFLELAERDLSLKEFYNRQPNGFYRCRELLPDEETILKAKFKALQFTALQFTDSRSVYQFYPLSRLWDDIQKALEQEILLWHPATEPVSAAEVYGRITGRTFKNELAGTPAVYDYRTVYAEAFGGKDGYLCSKEQVLEEIAAFVREQEVKNEN